MPARVANASVIGAIAFKEDQAEQAESLLQGAELYEPALLAFELASVARKKALLDNRRVSEVFHALELALAADMNWEEEDHAAVLRLALDTGLTTYDASYLYVARTLGLPLATFDGRLRRASGIA